MSFGPENWTLGAHDSLRTETSCDETIQNTVDKEENTETDLVSTG
jgi:hypothetical protein